MKEKIAGSLIGVAVGDALGFPFEGCSAKELKEVRFCYLPQGSYPAGTWSDDTSLTFITAESLLAKGRLDLHDLAQRFYLWLKEGYFTPHGRPLGFGRATVRALWRYAAGLPPEKAGGRGERDCGNGSLMRMAPVVLWFISSPEETLLASVHEASSLTHAHPRVLLACGLYALLLKGLSQKMTLNEAFLYVRERGMRFYSRNLPFAKEMSYFDLLWKGHLFHLKKEEIRASGYVVHTLLATFWILARTNNFREALKLAVSLGEDTDTTAAVVGSVAGFYYGLSQIPPSWCHSLVKGDHLLNLAFHFAEKMEAR